MLYGMDDYDHVDYNLDRKGKLNIKKIGIVIAIILLCALIVFISFSISYSILNKDKSELMQADIDKKLNGEQIEIKDDNKIENITITISKEQTVEENKKVVKNKKLVYYDGNHNAIKNHNLEEIKTKFVPKQNENASSLIKEIYSSEEKQVYLTFDDGPSKDITPQVLDILNEYDVKATFFVLGARVDLYPDTLKREYNEGHYIANHGYSHKYSQIYENADTVFQEYVQTEDSIKNALGNPDFNTYLFRFPGGSSGGHYEKVKSEARELFRNYGVAFTNWNCLTGDAEGKTTKEECMEEMIETKANQNSIILLMHDANDKSQTVEVLPELIEYYKNEGYTFKTFYEIFS